jgi:recombination protein RecA
MENDYGDSVMMQHAKLMGKFARRVSKIAKEYDAIVWVINQMRTGKSGHVTYNVASGGKAIPFYAKINIEMRRKSQSANQGKRVLPLEMNIRRNKMGASFRTIETCGIQGKAIDQTGELVDLAEELGMIYRAGSWWKQTADEGDDITLGQNLEDAKGWAIENKQLILDSIK